MRTLGWLLGTALKACSVPLHKTLPKGEAAFIISKGCLRTLFDLKLTCGVMNILTTR